MNVTTATPVEIDTEIARLSGLAQRAADQVEGAQQFLDRFAEVEGTYEANYPWFSADKVEAAQTSLAAAEQARHDAQVAMTPLSAEFTARGGWNRYYLVTNAGGHVHWTTACGTCFPSTSFAWLVDYSGMDRAAFVEEAGSKACTVCFPDAPVEVISRATRIKYEDADKRARREEREAKAAAKAAAEVRVVGYVDYGRVQTKTFKSVRAVTNDIAANLTGLCIYGEGHPSGSEWVSNVEALRAALAARGVSYDYDKALASARKRCGGQPSF